MSTHDVFAGSVSAQVAPGVLRGVAVSTVATTLTLTAANVLGGVQYLNDGGAAKSIVLPTAALLGAALFGRVAVGDTFEFVIVNAGAGVYTLTNSDLTVVGSNVTTAAGTGSSAHFLIRCTAIPTDVAGTGSAFTIYRAG